MSTYHKSVLLDKGVHFKDVHSVYIEQSVNPERIEPGVLIYPGCRLMGSQLAMRAGCVIGAEAPATVNNCQLSKKVQLKGGYYEGSVFLQGASTGSAAHVRPGCLLEEEANVAHAVGLKQTILMSFVTGGSLLNFCDILMAGGRSRTNHSEIGSSYIHFNFTPHGDKATASLVGDVPRGVLLDNEPIFLGGQGGLVGPADVTYGVVIPAGQIFRGQAENENHVCTSGTLKKMSTPYDTRVYKKIDRLVERNLRYLGNVYALREWYIAIRQPYMVETGDQACYEGTLRVFNIIIDERVKRLEQFATLLVPSIDALQSKGGNEVLIEEQRRFVKAWPELKARIVGLVNQQQSYDQASVVLQALECEASVSFADRVRTLTPELKATVVAWLSDRVQNVMGLAHVNE